MTRRLGKFGSGKRVSRLNNSLSNLKREEKSKKAKEKCSPQRQLWPWTKVILKLIF